MSSSASIVITYENGNYRPYDQAVCPDMSLW